MINWGINNLRVLPNLSSLAVRYPPISKLIKCMTCSPAGGLPLGFIIILSDAWGKKKSPKLFMTDDADAELMNYIPFGRMQYFFHMLGMC